MQFGNKEEPYAKVFVFDSYRSIRFWNSWIPRERNRFGGEQYRLLTNSQKTLEKSDPKRLSNTVVFPMMVESNPQKYSSSPR